MCKQVTVLANLDKFHRITRCNHGVIHLEWHTLSISMREQDFHTVAQEIKTAADTIDAGMQPRSHIITQSQNRVLIHFEEVTLRIHITKFTGFVAMFNHAANHPVHTTPRLSTPPRVRFYPN